MSDDNDYEWAILNSIDGKVEIDDMTRDEAEDWLEWWQSRTRKNDVYYVARRPKKIWERVSPKMEEE